MQTRGPQKAVPARACGFESRPGYLCRRLRATAAHVAAGGRGHCRALSQVTDFRIDVAQAELDDLRARLRGARLPERETVDDWSQGVPLAYLRDVCDYWATGYDWRVTEARLNSFPQLRTEIDGLGIHFIHARSPHSDALPLVMTHAWPGSIVEFLKAIGPLTDPTAHGGDASDAFHVVCPSLPGYGFSDKPAEPGWGFERIAAAARPRHFDDLTERERAALESLEQAREWDSGYSQEHATRPQTIGYSLADSPTGLCAWILEKFWSWTDHDGDFESVLTRDDLLDNIMLCSIFPRELQRPSRQAFFRLVR
jgi:hypothetical protein